MGFNLQETGYRKERNRSIIRKRGFYEPITKKWLFGILNFHSCRSKGVVFDNVRLRISKLDTIAPIELGRGVRNPGGFWAWLLGKNETLVGGNMVYKITN